MSNKLPSTIVDMLKSASGRRSLNVGLLLDGNLSIAEQVAALGHRTVVMGDRFRLLYRFYRHVSKGDGHQPLTAEARFGALPVQKQSLDALILSRGLPSGAAPEIMLARLRNLLKDTGFLIWPHPVTDGWRGKVGRVIYSSRGGNLRPIARQRLSALAMESGFVDVGQVLVGGPLVPWVVTSCRIGPRPWEGQTEKKNQY